MRRKDIEKLTKIAAIKVAQAQGKLQPFSSEMQQISRRIVDLDIARPALSSQGDDIQGQAKFEKWKVAERQALQIERAIIKEEARTYESALVNERARQQVLEKLAKTVGDTATQKHTRKLNNQVP